MKLKVRKIVKNPSNYATTFENFWFSEKCNFNINQRHTFPCLICNITDIYVAILDVFTMMNQIKWAINVGYALIWWCLTLKNDIIFGHFKYVTRNWKHYVTKKCEWTFRNALICISSPSITCPPQINRYIYTIRYTSQIWWKKGNKIQLNR